MADEYGYSESCRSWHDHPPRMVWVYLHQDEKWVALPPTCVHPCDFEDAPSRQPKDAIIMDESTFRKKHIASWTQETGTVAEKGNHSVVPAHDDSAQPQDVKEPLQKVEASEPMQNQIASKDASPARATRATDATTMLNKPVSTQTSPMSTKPKSPEQPKPAHSAPELKLWALDSRKNLGRQDPQIPYYKLKEFAPKVIQYTEIPPEWRQTFGRLRNDPLINPSKIGLDGKAVNGRWCFKQLLTDQVCDNPNCLGSHVPPNRKQFFFILSLHAKDPRTKADLNRNFCYNILKVYYRKHFLKGTTPVLTPRWTGTRLTAYPKLLRKPFYRGAEVPENMFSGTIIDRILDEWDELYTAQEKMSLREELLLPCSIPTTTEAQGNTEVSPFRNKQPMPTPPATVPPETAPQQGNTPSTPSIVSNTPASDVVAKVLPLTEENLAVVQGVLRRRNWGSTDSELVESIAGE
ncbi:hypothetical protein COCSADRAFT_164358 [Bipolaris sorokiniana ND90Pr]|uniref:Uncharacterized protein n=1 Tax=Cochliobolus sativus (strain ND90Pr / ATCC 201652) TaxID=665912 RepID=M2QYY0_COCSN|nr:uncharacterized protein COCSADRAFT_164358 [Bipolaris sorokiniana ND90Pr]EMD60229.1 hypothetical protein COCSADRAFT_164358 [Bipolaris sorokiniana ND90Pr]